MAMPRPIILMMAVGRRKSHCLDRLVLNPRPPDKRIQVARIDTVKKHRVVGVMVDQLAVENGDIAPPILRFDLWTKGDVCMWLGDQLLQLPAQLSKPIHP
jgi:hypothetical protein